MEIQYYGANCIRVTTKKANLLIDDNLAELGSKSVIKDNDTVLYTFISDSERLSKAKLLIDQPGEYEIGDTSVIGVPTRAYADETGTLNGTIFKLEDEDVKVAIIGNSYADISDSQLEMLGAVDVLIIPVGNRENGLSGADALKIVKRIEPYILIPTHFEDKNVKYKQPQATLEEALKELAMEPVETTPKLKLKSASFNEGDPLKLIVLET